MAERRLAFSPDSYRRYWQLRLCIVYGITVVINLVLLWLMFFDVPYTVLTGEIPPGVWYGPLGFLMLLNTVGIAGYAAYRYAKFRKLRALSHVTLADGAVVHYIQQPFMSDETARMALEGKWRRADAMAFYAAYLQFRITRVTKLGYSRFGAILVEGTVERTYHDEYLQVEDGVATTVMSVNRHKIPAYYEDMDALYRALEQLCRPQP